MGEEMATPSMSIEWHPQFVSVLTNVSMDHAWTVTSTITDSSTWEDVAKPRSILGGTVSS
jgi:hypothetical protein